MNKSGNSLKRTTFSTIYLESSAGTYPLARQVLASHDSCPVVTINHYKDVFNRANQDRRWQKEHPALILAVKPAPLLYQGPPVCQSFGHQYFRYATLMLNCPFDCSYCYLQGIYPSAYLVVFVNTDEILNAVQAEAARNPVYLALSHDADLLAMHAAVPCLDDLIPGLSSLENLQAEVRTKAANTPFFLTHQPCRQMVYAFSLAPDSIISQYETRTPGLAARLKTARVALEGGHAVRLCFDPVMIEPGKADPYPQFFDDVFHMLDPDRLVDISYGFFRMGRQLYRNLSKTRPDAAFLSHNLNTMSDPVSYHPDVCSAVKDRHLAVLSTYLPQERIFMI